ncbi:MAG: hypothetical protein JWM64_2635 [Frankiales bacterium]|nr:hypothetical protein [Frankiales bacterium]
MRGPDDLQVIAWCDLWSDLARAPQEELTEAQARRRHERGQFTTVALGRDGRASVLVVRNPALGHAAVHWMDEHARETQQYVYRALEVAPDRLFLTQVVSKTYADDAELSAYASPQTIETLELFPDGTGRLTVDDVRRDQVTAEDRELDTSDLFLQVPAFEDYRDLLPPED